jgi:hydrogenase nickel incorporation protein HypA/HybF
MHELSIVYGIVEAASEVAHRNKVRSVKTVNLRLGALSGVVKDALLFSYEIGTEGTPLEGSRLAIEELPAVIYCAACDAERELPDILCFRCPVCLMPSAEIRQGKELEIRSLEIEVADDEHPPA